jgi:hypothetical protein
VAGRSWMPVVRQAGTPGNREFRRVLKPGGHVLFSIGHPFMDMTYFQRADYFRREWVTDVWKKTQSGTIEMHFVSRPLSEVINATAACFTLVAVEEPQPISEFLKQFPDRADQHAYLMTRPHFLIGHAENAAQSTEG